MACGRVRAARGGVWEGARWEGGRGDVWEGARCHVRGVSNAPSRADGVIGRLEAAAAFARRVGDEAHQQRGAARDDGGWDRAARVIGDLRVGDGAAIVNLDAICVVN